MTLLKRTFKTPSITDASIQGFWHSLRGVVNSYHSCQKTSWKLNSWKGMIENLVQTVVLVRSGPWELVQRNGRDLETPIEKTAGRKLQLVLVKIRFDLLVDFSFANHLCIGYSLQIEANCNHRRARKYWQWQCDIQIQKLIDRIVNAFSHKIF